MNTAVLSEEIERRLAGRRVLAAAFTSFQLEPKFFEAEVLPVLFSIPASRAEVVRLDALQRAITSSGARLAVYYDPRGLVPSERSTKLGIPCSPISATTGFFHPKVALILVQDDASRACSLVVVAGSANLTEAGWWRNVEACHVEEIVAGDATHLRQDVLDFTKGLRGLAHSRAIHPALDAVDAFLIDEVRSRVNRTSGGALHVRLLTTNGRGLLEALRSAAGDTLRGHYLEVLSPFFDQPADAGTGPTAIESLLDWARPSLARILLPLDQQGRALVSRELHERIARRDGVAWARLDHGVARERKSLRHVHAKVLRILDKSARLEWLVVGSHNATRAAHGGANLECSFLVENATGAKPEAWLTPIEAPPSDFAPKGEADEATGSFVPLVLSYSWSAPSESQGLAACWDAAEPSPPLRVTTMSGHLLFDLLSLPPRERVTLDGERAARIREHLRTTAFVLVEREGSEPALLLVEEDGVGSKDSVQLTLSLEDILRCWTFLTDDQRAEFLDARGDELAAALEGAGITDGCAAPLASEDGGSMFASLATTYRAFSQLERAIGESLRAGHVEHAIARLFTQADSLNALLRRVRERGESGDAVHGLVVFLCAEQLLERLVAAYPDFASQPGVCEKLERLRATARDRDAWRQRLDIPDRDRFLAWLEPRFLERAAPRAAKRGAR